MKKLIYLSLVFIMVGCNDYYSDYPNGVVIYKGPYRFGGDTIKNDLWRYGYTLMGDYHEFYDSANKYNVGDTIPFLKH